MNCPVCGHVHQGTYCQFGCETGIGCGCKYYDRQTPKKCVECQHVHIGVISCCHSYGIGPICGCMGKPDRDFLAETVLDVCKRHPVCTETHNTDEFKGFCSHDCLRERHITLKSQIALLQTELLGIKMITLTKEEIEAIKKFNGRSRQVLAKILFDVRVSQSAALHNHTGHTDPILAVDNYNDMLAAVRDEVAL